MKAFFFIVLGCIIAVAGFIEFFHSDGDRWTFNRHEMAVSFLLIAVIWLDGQIKLEFPFWRKKNKKSNNNN